MGRQGLRLSGVLAVLLVALINIDWARQQPTPQFTAGGYSSPIATPQQVALLAPSIASPLGAEAESSVNNLPANEMDKVPETNVQDSQIILGLRMQAEPAAELSSSIQAASAALGNLYTGTVCQQQHTDNLFTGIARVSAGVGHCVKFSSRGPDDKPGLCRRRSEGHQQFSENIDQGYLPCRPTSPWRGSSMTTILRPANRRPARNFSAPAIPRPRAATPFPANRSTFWPWG
ncbi:MAG: hypothetical protein R2867_08330 [Caldilineaceae bacterium]